MCMQFQPFRVITNIQHNLHSSLLNQGDIICKTECYTFNRQLLEQQVIHIQHYQHVVVWEH